MINKEMTTQECVGWESPVAIHPGEFLLDTLEEYSITQADLAVRIGVSKKLVNEIINGKNSITESIAMKLSKVFPLSMEYWLNLQTNYEADCIRLNQDEELKKDEKFLTDYKNAYKELGTIGKTNNLRWIKKNYNEIILELQHYFGVASLEYVNASMDFAFRKYERNHFDHQSLAAWLRLGQIKAQHIETPSFDKNRLMDSLGYIKKLSLKDKREYLKLLEDVLKKCGIVLVYAPYFHNTHVQAATTWINSEKALIMIATSDGKDEGKFWFNLFHEIGHLLLHSKKEFHIDLVEEYSTQSEIEDEANDFAQKLLVSDIKGVMSELYLSDDAEKRLMEIADENGISSAILAGRITHELKDVNKNIYAMMSKYLQVRINESNV